MKSAELKKYVEGIRQKVELEYFEKNIRHEAERNFEASFANDWRARSVTVGTSFGGTSELTMRGDGDKRLWCVMQPVEVIELIHQLAANVGCNAELTPRKDFSSWRDWRVSEAEKKHLNGHPPFVNDMAVFQQLGASGYNEEEAQKIMNILADSKCFANEDVKDKVIAMESPDHAGPNLMMSEESGKLVNKVRLNDEGEVIYMAGGNGGKPRSTHKELKNGEDTVAAKKTVNKRTTKRAARAS